MAEGNDREVAGSVIQRTIVAGNMSSVVSIATAPADDLAFTDDADFNEFVADILGVNSSSVVDPWLYDQVLGHIPEFLMPSHPGYELWQQAIFRSPEGFSALAHVLGDSENAKLAAHALALMTRSSVLPDIGTIPFWKYPDGLLPGVSEEAFALALRCQLSAASISRRSNEFLGALGNYHIPSGQSPATESDSLLKIIGTSKKVCLAPLAAGGVAGLSSLAQGAFATALLATGTGAGMTLILISTVSVADYLVHYMLHRRNAIRPGGRPRTPPTKHRPPPTAAAAG